MLGRSTSYSPRGLTTPRPGAFTARRPRSLLARAFARNSPLRHMDWILVVVVLGLTAIGTLLVWSATEPSLAAAGAFGGFPLDKVCVAGKTGTAQLFGKNATSVFASFAPCDHPKYVVLVMVPDSGYGADVAAPAVRQIWDGIYGLEGKKAAVRGGLVPSALPQITTTGAIKPPSGYAQSGGGK